MGVKNSDKKQEASNRLLQLKQSLHISQRILKGFDNGKLFYSYIPLVGNAKIAVLDKKRLEDNYISAYVYNINHPECSEFGDIILTGNNGALVRTDVLM